MDVVWGVVIFLIVGGISAAAALVKVNESRKRTGFKQVQLITAQFLVLPDWKNSEDYRTFYQPFMDEETDNGRVDLIRQFFASQEASKFVMKRFADYYAEVFHPWFLRDFERKLEGSLGKSNARSHHFSGKSYTLIWDAAQELKEKQKQTFLAAEAYQEKERKRRTTEKKARQAAANLVKAQVAQEKADAERGRKQRQFNSQLKQKRSALRNPNPSLMPKAKSKLDFDAATQADMFINSLSENTRKRFLAATPSVRTTLINKHSADVPAVDFMNPIVFTAILTYQDSEDKSVMDSVDNNVSHADTSFSAASGADVSTSSAVSSHASSSYDSTPSYSSPSYDSGSSYSSFDGGSFGGGE